MKKNKSLLTFFVAIFVVAIVGVSSVSAQGFVPLPSSPSAVQSAAMPTDQYGRKVTGALVPGMVAVVNVTLPVAETIYAAELPLPRELGGFSLLVGGKLAPLFWVGPKGITFQVPDFEGTPGDILSVTVRGPQQTAQVFRAVAAESLVGGFTVSDSQGEYLLVQATVGYVLGRREQVILGDDDFYHISLWGTGARQRSSFVPGVAAEPDNILSSYKVVIVNVDGTLLPPETLEGVWMVGVGLIQINLKIPKTAPDGYPLRVTPETIQVILDGQRLNPRQIVSR